MRWKNKGHENDHFADKLVKQYGKMQKIYIFGAGVKGRELAATLEKYNCFAGYIDNSIEKQKKGCFSVPGKYIKYFRTIKKF